MGKGLAEVRLALAAGAAGAWAGVDAMRQATREARAHPAVSATTSNLRFMAESFGSEKNAAGRAASAGGFGMEKRESGEARKASGDYCENVRKGETCAGGIPLRCRAGSVSDRRTGARRPPVAYAPGSPILLVKGFGVIRMSPCAHGF
jgi:hypothetical protein